MQHCWANTSRVHICTYESVSKLWWIPIRKILFILLLRVCWFCRRCIHRQKECTVTYLFLLHVLTSLPCIFRPRCSCSHHTPGSCFLHSKLHSWWERTLSELQEVVPNGYQLHLKIAVSPASILHLWPALWSSSGNGRLEDSKYLQFHCTSGCITIFVNLRLSLVSNYYMDHNNMV